MKIGVISDTHLREPHPEFKKVIEFHFKDVEKIFHAGDFVDWSIAEYLSSQKELIAVYGNMDSYDIRKAFPEKRVIELKGFKIGLIHGGGSPFGIESRIQGEFDEVNAIVYGHSHTPANHQVKNIYFFNPGSPTRSFVHRATLGILYLGEKIEGEIIKI
ncbi:MAG: metallophosphoesterase [Deltaproteobacteria bacterium CG_4_8_14_3_um_filter_45_9]|nr:MAG: metallophosphoesterase [Deltaproteobacteria bacterium CG03_land_8_20_14_0_80_45_14]PIX26631.1 MAG: metallophosphoesterase [Deltaproteobacteria bacterium CG_4_8_14_3_um_filter_45_9]